MHFFLVQLFILQIIKGSQSKFSPIAQILWATSFLALKLWGGSRPVGLDKCHDQSIMKNECERLFSDLESSSKQGCGRTLLDRGSGIWGDICPNDRIHFYHDHYFTWFIDKDYIRWMYKLHSSVIEVYSGQPQSLVVYGMESRNYRLPRQPAVDFRGSTRLFLVVLLSLKCH